MSLTDQQLVTQLRNGDQSAFGEIVERHQRAVYGYLRARIVQSSDADDLTQDVFLRFYLAQARFDSAALIRPWLLGIARNLLRERVRDHKRRREVGWTELCLDIESVLPASAWDSDEDALLQLPGCLDQLGPSSRQALDLRYRSEKRLAEIGETMHRSEGAIKLLMHRARIALRECLESKRKGAR